MEKIKKKYSKTDCLILGIGFLILGLFVLSIAIPIVYVVLASFMAVSYTHLSYFERELSPAKHNGRFYSTASDRSLLLLQ